VSIDRLDDEQNRSNQKGAAVGWRVKFRTDCVGVIIKKYILRVKRLHSVIRDGRNNYQLELE
jgi:hypothetical protein